MSRKERREKEEKEAIEQKKREKKIAKEAKENQKTNNAKNKQKKEQIKKQSKFEPIEKNEEEDKDEIVIKQLDEIEQYNTHTAKEKKKVETKKQPKSKKNKWHTVKKVVLSILMFFIIIIELATFSAGCYVIYLGHNCDWDTKQMFKKGVKQVALAITGQTEADLENLDPIYCLILGISTDEGTELTDTIMVAAYYPKTQQASILSIPRDTYVGTSKEHAGSGAKINAQYSYGGAERVLKTVNTLTGLDIKNYIVVRNEGLIQLVDAIGGVWYDVPINMDYDDGKQKLHIHLKRGYQKLNGDQAEGLVRFRHNNDWTSYPIEYGDNDLGRMKTQRNFIIETLKQTLRAENITPSRINDLIEIAFKNIDTNVDLNYALKYSPAIIDFDVSAIENAHLPGNAENFGPYNTSFYVASETQTKKIIKQFFTFKQETYESDEDEGAIPLKPENIKIQILNASGDEEKFNKIVTKLEKAGYNIQEKGDTTFVKTTRIINRTQKKEDVTAELTKTLGNENVLEGKDISGPDYTIIVGEDI